jgi:hypothetical protein
MACANLLKLAAAYNVPNQTAVIDSLTKESGILRTMQFQKASHGLFHKFKIKASLPSGGFRRVNGSIVPHTTFDEVRQEDLKILTDIQQEDKAICEAYPGGVEKYFADEAPAFLEGLGQTAARQLIYGTTPSYGDTEGFRGLRQYAELNDRIIPAGGNSGERTTILAVRWKAGTCVGLYNENAFAEGQLVAVKPLNQGQPVMVTVDPATGAVKPVYQALYEAYLGLLVADTANVAAYTEITDASGHKPTSSNLDKLIDLVNGSPSDTFIYVNRLSRRLLWELKESKMQTSAAEGDYNHMIERWNGIPVMLEENLSATETI